MAMINFETKLFSVGKWTLFKLPAVASAKLPSRGQVMVEGSINGYRFQAPLEPDGLKGHWLKLNSSMLEGAGAKTGDTVQVALEPSKTWPEPTVPADLRQALARDAEARELWQKITPMARWDWIRWVGATANPDTRKRHVEVACSKLRAGTRRPCCFNRSACADFTVSRNGILADPILV